MSKRILIGRRELTCENGKTAQLSYYLLEEEQLGAEIVMEREGSWESASVRRLTTSRRSAEDFVERLKGSCVTPCALQDVSSDFLSEIRK